MDVKELDEVPSYTLYRPVVLRFLHDREQCSVIEMIELTANHFHLSEKVKQATNKKGQVQYQDRVYKTFWGLERARFVRRTSPCMYQITPEGDKPEYYQAHEITDEVLKQTDGWKQYQNEKNKGQLVAEGRDVASFEGVQGADDLTVLPGQIVDMAERVASDIQMRLKKKLQEGSPEFFERVVLQLLWKMGYGGANGVMKHTGGVFDGGIDGVIWQDALGLSRLYLQAKRYADKNYVGVEEVRQFIGALAAQDTAQGVFLTTSFFYEDAKREAWECKKAKVVLVDGVQLTAYMLQYGVGVRETSRVSLYEIDEDFFTGSKSQEEKQ